ncbi:MAG: bifunctional oligoribonuclease/PAP phosphatase NrnA [Thermoleophilia bacterium]|nr:bifunctional oligoribonuclease/PAP phosphatase NrnA [Thermoleophilia bacterium]
MTTKSETAAVADALRANDRFVVTSHENPDGDALGSLLATHLALVELGKDSVMVLVGESPLPGEYRFLDVVGAGLLRVIPEDQADRVLVAVDCAQETRLTDARLLDAPLIVNIDHHHDNTRFGGVNLVADGASSTAEVLADVFAELGLSLTPAIAEALYTGLVTDTGRFQYSNTTPKALHLAAELVEARANPKSVFQAVYESMPFPKLKLLARALERASLHADGRVVISYLVREDFSDVHALEPYSEGIIDILRAVEGVELAALIREPPRDDGPARKVSLRSSTERVDVSAIARKSNGGGHRQAAGFSSDLPLNDVIAFIVAEFTALPAPAA